jgi:hypothetical protein
MGDSLARVEAIARRPFPLIARHVLLGRAGPIPEAGERLRARVRFARAIEKATLLVPDEWFEDGDPLAAYAGYLTARYEWGGFEQEAERAGAPSRSPFSYLTFASPRFQRNGAVKRRGGSATGTVAQRSSGSGRGYLRASERRHAFLSRGPLVPSRARGQTRAAGAVRPARTVRRPGMRQPSTSARPPNTNR